MISSYQEVASRIKSELQTIEELVLKVQYTWSQIDKLSNHHEVFIDSVALNLHGFYSGFEKLFELIANHIDRQSPEGEYWHRELLHRMAQELSGVRPAVISSNSAEKLDEFRRFRHIVRNVYATHLDPEKIRPMVNTLPEFFPKVKAELLSFSEFLEEIAKS